MEENKKVFARTCLYSKEKPEGKIYVDEAEYNAALNAGWVEAPQDIGLAPEEIKKRNIKRNPMSRIEVLEKEVRELKAESSKLKAENEELKVKQQESEARSQKSDKDKDKK